MADLYGRGDPWPEPDEMSVMPVVYTASVARRADLIVEKARRLLDLAAELRALPVPKDGEDE